MKNNRKINNNFNTVNLIILIINMFNHKSLKLANNLLFLYQQITVIAPLIKIHLIIKIQLNLNSQQYILLLLSIIIKTI